MTSEERVLLAAEAHARIGGYNGFSFRDIAQETGLTNAGIHHHFPTKADLVVRLAEEYTARFTSALENVSANARVTHLRALFADSLRKDGKMCLCGLLAAECGGLPDPVASAARKFFDDLTELLMPAFPDSTTPRADALHVLACLEGAALLATTLKDPTVFDTATIALVPQ